jgi:hypothetical protein
MVTGCVRAPSQEAMLKTAHEYSTHQWKGSQANILHGADPDHVTVHTPDNTMFPDGWSAAGKLNMGIPYTWGGFSSIEEFEEGVAQGKLAGHIFRKGDKLDRSVYSKHTVGVDCSGLVSRCWGIPFKLGTSTLYLVSDRLADYQELQPGDALNRPGAHVMLFEKFSDPKRTHADVYEAITDLQTMGRVKKSTYSIEDLRKGGYISIRYSRSKLHGLIWGSMLGTPPRSREP